jgi:hypothetical protein
MVKVEFSLTYENYLDLYRGSKLLKSPKIVGKLLTTSLLVICFGFLFARESNGPELPQGSLAVSIGLIVAVLCLPLWLVMERGASARNNRELRRNFEHFFRAPRSLEFDDNGLTYTYGSARNAMAWRDLTSYAQFGQTLVLADEFVQYMVPLATLKEEERFELKEKCKQALGIRSDLPQFDVSTTALRYARASVYYRWRRRPLRMMSLYLIGAVFACLTAAIFANALSIHVWPITTALVLLMPLAELVTDLAKFPSYKKLYSFESAVISEQSICFCDARRLWKLRMAWLIDWLETPWEFQLRVTEDQFYMIPKIGLPMDRVNGFREQLATLNLL